VGGEADEVGKSIGIIAEVLRQLIAALDASAELNDVPTRDVAERAVNTDAEDTSARLARPSA
jgi:hypothetical protein